MRKRRVVGKIYGMKYCWKVHKDRNRYKNRTKKKEWASSVGFCQRHKLQHLHHEKVSQRGPKEASSIYCKMGNASFVYCSVGNASSVYRAVGNASSVCSGKCQFYLLDSWKCNYFCFLYTGTAAPNSRRVRKACSISCGVVLERMSWHVTFPVVWFWRGCRGMWHFLWCGSGEAVVACDVPQLCTLPSRNS